MLTPDKELRKIIKEAEGVGWRFEKRRRHIFGKGPHGETTTISLTPSDRGNVYKKVRRYLGLNHA